MWNTAVALVLICGAAISGPWVTVDDIDIDNDEVTIEYGYKADWDTQGAPASQTFVINVYTEVYYNDNSNSGRIGTSYRFIYSDQVSFSETLNLGDREEDTVGIGCGGGHKVIVRASISGDGWWTFWDEDTEYDRF